MNSYVHSIMSVKRNHFIDSKLKLFTGFDFQDINTDKNPSAEPIKNDIISSYMSFYPSENNVTTALTSLAFGGFVLLAPKEIMSPFSKEQTDDEISFYTFTLYKVGEQVFFPKDSESYSLKKYKINLGNIDFSNDFDRLILKMKAEGETYYLQEDDGSTIKQLTQKGEYLGMEICNGYEGNDKSCRTLKKSECPFSFLKSGDVEPKSCRLQGMGSVNSPLTSP